VGLEMADKGKDEKEEAAPRLDILKKLKINAV
jgi:hypothetical protein